MIVDTLDNLEKYASLSPLLAQAVQYFDTHSFSDLPMGKTILQEGDIWASVAQTSPKTADEAKLETHRQMIDIQLPLSGDETIGYTPVRDLAPAPYDEAKDITFFPGKAESYIRLQPGMFAIFFPQDAHAPGITPTGVKKVVVKVRNSK